MLGVHVLTMLNLLGVTSEALCPRATFQSPRVTDVCDGIEGSSCHADVLQAPSRVAEMQPRHVANLAWAFAVRKAYSPSLYDALAARMVQLIALDRGADTAGSSSATDASHESLFTAVNDEVLPHHLSLVAWSFAKQVRSCFCFGSNAVDTSLMRGQGADTYGCWLHADCLHWSVSTCGLYVVATQLDG